VESADRYIYTYACHEDERPLCRLELRSLFGFEPRGDFLESPLNLDPSRSPFIKLQVAVMYEGSSLRDIAKQAEALQLHGSTFKVVFVETDAEASYDEQRAMEREVGAHIGGKADMRKPERLFGILRIGIRWLLGECRYNEAVWLKHIQKPQNYSTALSTRVARAVVNIAVPDPQRVKAIDPCCGIGTVLIEALSMGINIIGCDVNPLAIRGARANLAHFGFPDVVKAADMRKVTGRFDAAIVDLPYNLCSKITVDEQLEMLRGSRNFSDKAVVITAETMDPIIERAGFIITDHCLIKKGKFTRHVAVCL
jgi:tRNA G10  N-methylase Trm11